jgi:hypothetical protein
MRHRGPAGAAGKQRGSVDSGAADSGLVLDQAFTPFGPMSPQFGRWMWEYVPKYAAAVLAADIDGVPVSIDAHMPTAHRQFLRMLFPSNTEIIESRFRRVCARRSCGARPACSWYRSSQKPTIPGG